MAEPASTGLIGTKYARPKTNQYLISRQRLRRILNRALTCKLTTVVAPAGYGKTSAVLDWLGECGLPAAWLSVDSYDDNPMTFWRYVCIALDGICDGVSKETEYVFSSPELLKAKVHLNILIDLLSKVQSDFLLVLDDLHTVNEPSILDGLCYLIDYLPPRMHLVFISRAEPQLKLSRQRIKWQTQRLGERDLRFGEEEIFRFYQARGHILENDDLKKVETYTEGWAAALVAVAMSMEDADGGNDAIAALTRSSRDIEQYLEDEVISTWRSERLSFAMKTCILDTLTESLCDAVTGDGNGRRMLKEISEGSGFLTALGEQKQEYRFHHLFKRFLYRVLSETAPEEIPSLHARAARWFRERGLVRDAIEHLLSGGFYREASEMIERHLDPLVHRNDFGTLLSWIDRLPAEYVDNSFKIAVIYAVYYAETGQHDLSRQWVARVKALKDAPQYASDPAWTGYCRTVSILVEANLLVREGDIEFLPLLLSAAETDEDGSFRMLEYLDFNTADVYYYRCPISRAARLFREAPEQYSKMTDSYRRLISRNPGYAPLGIGEYLYESNRLDEALPYLLKAVEEARAADCMGALVPSMVDIARMKRAQGDVRGTLEALDECEKEIRKRSKAHWLYLVQALRCRLHMDAGDATKVDEWFASRRLGVFTEIDRIKEFELIAYARVLAARDRRQAATLLQRLLSFAEENSRLHSTVEVLNLLAMLSFRNNDMPGAVKYLDRSLKIGVEQGYVRSYLDEFTPMAQLLKYYTTPRRKQTTRLPLIAYSKDLLRQMHEDLPDVLGAHNESAAAEIRERLTDQELKVLDLLAEACTNNEISARLGIGLRTVKTHTGNIYAKLGVKNRAQCVKVAREAKLL